MAHNIYDKNGKLIGKVKTEEEANREEAENILGAMGCILVVALGFLAICLLGAWLFGVAVMFDPNHPDFGFLPIMIPDLIVTIVVGRKIVSKGIRTPWGAFWRVALIDTCVGLAGGFVYAANVIGLGGIRSWDGYDWAETIGFGIFFALWFSISPAFVVSRIVARREKMNSK